MDHLYGSQYPENYIFQIEDGEHTKEIIVRHGYIVDAIGFVIAKPCGGTYTKMFGGFCGQESRIVLKCGEKLTKISGTYGNFKLQRNQCVIASIKIYTNECPEGYGPYGQGLEVDCPRDFVSPCPFAGPIVGIYGRHNNFIESVGFFVKEVSIRALQGNKKRRFVACDHMLTQVACLRH